jgi:hypothetical protein
VGLGPVVAVKDDNDFICLGATAVAIHPLPQRPIDIGRLAVGLLVRVFVLERAARAPAAGSACSMLFVRRRGPGIAAMP